MTRLLWLVELREEHDLDNRSLAGSPTRAHIVAVEADDAEGAMDKARSGASSRKPPVPSDDHAGIDDWMRRVMPDLQPIVRRLDELVRTTLPRAQYAVKWKKAYYGLPDLGWIIEIVAYDVSVNVVFFGGAELDPPPPLGTTDRSRYVKVKSLDELEQPDLRRWIEGAGRVAGWR